MTLKRFAIPALVPAAGVAALSAAAPLNGPDVLGLVLIVLLAVGLREHNALDDPA